MRRQIVFYKVLLNLFIAGTRLSFNNKKITFVRLTDKDIKPAVTCICILITEWCTDYIFYFYSCQINKSILSIIRLSGQSCKQNWYCCSPSIRIYYLGFYCAVLYTIIILSLIVRNAKLAKNVKPQQRQFLIFIRHII